MSSFDNPETVDDLTKGFINETSQPEEEPEQDKQLELPLEDDSAEAKDDEQAEAEAEEVEEDDEAEVEEDEEADEDDEDEDDEAEAEEEPKKRKKTAEDRVKEIKRSTREMRERERAALAAEQRARELLAELKAAENPEKELTGQNEADKTQDSNGPDPKNYKYGEVDPEFTRDLARFEAKAMLEAERKNQEQERLSQEAAVKQKELGEKLRNQLDKGSELFDDFEELVQGPNSPLQDLPVVDESIAESIINSDAAPQIMYHLATNLEEAQSFATKSPIEQARYIGRLEAKLTPSDKKARSNKTTRKIKNPPSKVRASSGAADRSDESLDFEDFYKKYGG